MRNKINVKKIWEQVKENQKRLNGCTSHNFIELIDGELQTGGTIYTSRKIGKRFKCLNCGGQIESTNKNWYDKGLKHGQLVNV